MEEYDANKYITDFITRCYLALVRVYSKRLWVVLLIILLFLSLASHDCPCFIHGYDAVQELIPFNVAAFR
jgi:hypothetical protein